MEFSIKSVSPEKQRSACCVVGVFESGKLTTAAESIDKATNGRLSEIVGRGDMDGKTGSTLILHDLPSLPCERLLLVGLGKKKEFGEKEYNTAIRKAFKALKETGAANAVLFITETPVSKRSIAWRIRQATIIAQESTYRFEQFKSKKQNLERSLNKVTFVVAGSKDIARAEEALAQGTAIAD